VIEGLKPYAEYKKSGQDWLGQVPAHWDLRPGHAAFVAQSVSNRGLKEKTVLSLSFGRIKVKPTDKQHGLMPSSYETYQIVDQGNIIIRGTDLQNDKTSLRIGLARNRGIISSAYICLKTRETVSPDYGYQILNVFDLTKAIYRYGSGLRQNLDYGEIKRLPIFIPPADEQASIVRFLDTANQQINSFIIAKRKLIGILVEQKQAIIQRATTRGVNRSARLRPSCIPWVGEIPTHWKILRAKYLFREVDERSASGTEEQLSVSHLTGVSPRSEKNITMFKAASYIGHKICRPGDLAINTMWAWMGALGVAHQEGIISPAYAVYRPRDGHQMHGTYVEMLLRTRAYTSNFMCRSTGVRASRLRLYPDEFFRMPILVPPFEEQIEISQVIDGETSSLSKAISRIEREIALLQEYRTRLTTDITTGQVDVRDAASKLTDVAANEGSTEETEFIEEESIETENEESDE
jgi:type I restriction enzyme, S subunit